VYAHALISDQVFDTNQGDRVQHPRAAGLSECIAVNISPLKQLHVENKTFKRCKEA